MTEEEKTAAIAALNDRHRTQASQGWVFTDGVAALGEAFMIKAMMAVRAFATFTEDNDPYGERDFGAVTVEGHRMFWKIDYYDIDLIYGSPDATDPAVTRRVLTVMLTREY